MTPTSASGRGLVLGLVVAFLLLAVLAVGVFALITRTFLGGRSPGPEVPVMVSATVRPDGVGLRVEQEVTAVDGSLPTTLHVIDRVRDAHFVDFSRAETSTSAVGEVSELTVDTHPTRGLTVRLPEQTATVRISYLVTPSAGDRVATISSPFRETRARQVEVTVPEPAQSCLIPAGRVPNQVEVSATSCPTSGTVTSRLGTASDPELAKFGEVHPWVRLRF